MLKIDQTSTSQTYTLDPTHGSAAIDLTAEVPTGARVLAGGWRADDTTSGSNFTLNVFSNAPTSDQDGWEFKAFASATPGDEIAVTVYATYAQVD
jgi:hypothetical protein